MHNHRATNEDNLRWVVLNFVVALCLVGAVMDAIAQPKTFVDDAGRRVVLPSKIERIYAAGPPASVLVMAIAPGKTDWLDTRYQAG